MLAMMIDAGRRHWAAAMGSVMTNGTDWIAPHLHALDGIEPAGDFDRGLAWTLLTNRIHPTRHFDSGIVALRRVTADRVLTF